MDAGHGDASWRHGERGDTMSGSMTVDIACTFAARLKGLAGNHRSDAVLLLVPCSDVHTYTMARPIDVAFVSAEGEIVESHRCVPPRKRLRNRGSVAVLERYSTNARWPEEGEAFRLGWNDRNDQDRRTP